MVHYDNFIIIIIMHSMIIITQFCLLNSVGASNSASVGTTLCTDNVSIGNGCHFNSSIALRYTDKELGGN